jgi:hypothetical protein
MDHRQVKDLEEAIEDAIRQIFRRPIARDLPMNPSPHTVHLMAKAAVTVYEAAYENCMDDEE